MKDSDSATFWVGVVLRFARVVDMMTCVEARVFKGTYYSSFSDAIQRLRVVRGTAHADDEHLLTPPEWDAVKLGGTRDVSVSLDDPATVALLRLMEEQPDDMGKVHAAWLAEGWGGAGDAGGGMKLSAGALS